MEDKKNNIHAVVVLYNPEDSIFENISTYINDVDCLYVIDNSELQNKKIIDKLLLDYVLKMTYIHNKNEGGIAKALNIGAQLAIRNNAEWLLTMDQDSFFNLENHFSHFLDYLKKVNINEVSIVSPFHQTNPKHFPDFAGPMEVSDVMTSGNLLNLNVYKKIGGFREEFFIDFVDIDYCMRSKKEGFKIIKYNEVFLVHKLGEKKIYFNKISVTNHNHIRRYYITRNRLVLIKELFFTNFSISIRMIKNFLLDFFKIIFFEEKKIKKMISIIKGVYDFLFFNTNKQF